LNAFSEEVMIEDKFLKSKEYIFEATKYHPMS